MRHRNRRESAGVYDFVHVNRVTLGMENVQNSPDRRGSVDYSSRFYETREFLQGHIFQDEAGVWHQRRDEGEVVMMPGDQVTLGTGDVLRLDEDGELYLIGENERVFAPGDFVFTPRGGVLFVPGDPMERYRLEPYEDGRQHRRREPGTILLTPSATRVVVGLDGMTHFRLPNRPEPLVPIRDVFAARATEAEAERGQDRNRPEDETPPRTGEGSPDFQVGYEVAAALAGRRPRHVRRNHVPPLIFSFSPRPRRQEPQRARSPSARINQEPPDRPRPEENGRRASDANQQLPPDRVSSNTEETQDHEDRDRPSSGRGQTPGLNYDDPTSTSSTSRREETTPGAVPPSPVLGNRGRHVGLRIRVGGNLITIPSVRQATPPDQRPQPSLQHVDPRGLASRALGAGIAHVRTMSAWFPIEVSRTAEDIYADLHYSGALDGDLGDVSMRAVAVAALWEALNEHWHERPEEIRRITDFSNRRRAR